jgi:hypothetical protein
MAVGAVVATLGACTKPPGESSTPLASDPIPVAPSSAAVVSEVSTPRTSASSAPTGPVIAVGHDPDSGTISFFGDDGSTLGAVDVPAGLILARPVRPSPFVYGLLPDGSLTVADAATMTAATYAVPEELDTLTEINGSTVVVSLALPGFGAGADAVLVDLETGAMTSMRDLVGRQDAHWERVGVVGDNVVLFDTGAWHSIVIPRSDPLTWWEADSIIRGEDGGTFVGNSPTPARGTIVHAYRGAQHTPVTDLFDAMDPAHVVGSFLVSSSRVIVALDTGELSAVDLDAHTVRVAGQLSVSPDFIGGLAKGVQLVAVSGSTALVNIETNTVIDANDDGTYIDYGSGSKCALIERNRSDYKVGKAFMIDLASGEIAAELGSEPIPLAADGCSAVDARNTTVAVNGKLLTLGQGWFYDLDDSHSSILFRGTDGVTHIVQLSDQASVALPPANDYRFVEV